MTEKLKQLTELHVKHEELLNQIELIEMDMGILKSEILQHFSDNDIQNMSINGFTVYRSSQTWCSAPDVKNLTPVLQAHGMGEIVKPTINTQSLSAWVRELKKKGDLPADILAAEQAGWIKISPKHIIAMRKA